jgi:hypothetical protein
VNRTTGPAGSHRSRVDRVRYADTNGDESIGELVGLIAADVRNLVTSEIEMAKVELRDEAKRAGRAAGMLGAGSFIAYLAILLLSFAAAWGLAEWLDSPGLGFLIIGVIYAVIAAVLLMQGRNRLREVHPVPEETIATLKEDVQWLKQQAS